MRLKRIEIKNYRSLKEITLDDLKNLNVFIGKNGSGKSHILEALELFFRDLNLLQPTEKGFEENLWFDGDKNVPIYFKIQIELTEKQIDDLFTKTFYDAIHLGENNKIKTKCITIESEIQSSYWSNKNVAFGDWSLVVECHN